MALHFLTDEELVKIVNIGELVRKIRRLLYLPNTSRHDSAQSHDSRTFFQHSFKQVQFSVTICNPS